MQETYSKYWDSLNAGLSKWKILIVPGTVLYLLLVALLCYRRVRNTSKRFNFKSRESFAKMTTDDAQAILKDLTELEFPKIMGFSIIFALFKVWTIRSHEWSKPQWVTVT